MSKPLLALSGSAGIEINHFIPLRFNMGAHNLFSQVHLRKRNQSLITLVYAFAFLRDRSAATLSLL